MKGKEIPVDIGLPVYNEEKNIERLIINLVSQPLPNDFELNNIIVVSSSIDQTDEIVRDLSKLDNRIKLIRENERHGKSAAIKIILSTSTSDIIIMSSGDIYPVQEAIYKLLIPFKDKKVGYTAGRPIPLDGRDQFWGYAGHFIWNLQSYFAPQDHGKLAGELNAFRNGIIKEIPDHIINDDLYLQFAVEKAGYRSVYVPDALIITQPPQSLKDYIRQRRRVRIGHLQLKKELGVSVTTANPFKALKIIIREGVWTLAIVLIEGIAYLLAYIDLKLGRIPRGGWRIAKTTKAISEEKLSEMIQKQ